MTTTIKEQEQWAFSLNKVEKRRLEAWLKRTAQKRLAAGAAVTLSFTYTGIGIHVEASFKGETPYDLTDYDAW